MTSFIPYLLLLCSYSSSHLISSPLISSYLLSSPLLSSYLLSSLLLSSYLLISLLTSSHLISSPLHTSPLRSSSSLISSPLLFAHHIYPLPYTTLHCSVLRRTVTNTLFLFFTVFSSFHIVCASKPTEPVLWSNG